MCEYEKVKIRGERATQASKSGFKYLRVSENLEFRDWTKTFQNFALGVKISSAVVYLCCLSEHKKPTVGLRSKFSHTISIESVWFSHQSTATGAVLIGLMHSKHRDDTNATSHGACKWLASILSFYLPSLSTSL